MLCNLGIEQLPCVLDLYVFIFPKNKILFEQRNLDGSGQRKLLVPRNGVWGR